MRRPHSRVAAILPVVLLAVLACGCSGNPRVSALPSNQITVLPPRNHGGTAALVTPEAISVVYYRQAPERFGTFGDYLAREMEIELARRGYSVTHPSTVEQATRGRAPDSPSAAASVARSSNLPGPVLFTEITECDAEPEDGNIVFNVGADLSLVDLNTATVLWKAHVPAQDVALRDEGGRGRASREAAMWLARQALIGVKPVTGYGAPR